MCEFTRHRLEGRSALSVSPRRRAIPIADSCTCEPGDAGRAADHVGNRKHCVEPPDVDFLDHPRRLFALWMIKLLDGPLCPKAPKDLHNTNLDQHGLVPTGLSCTDRVIDHFPVLQRIKIDCDITLGTEIKSAILSTMALSTGRRMWPRPSHLHFVQFLAVDTRHKLGCSRNGGFRRRLDHHCSARR